MTMAIELPNLPYSTNALEPQISRQTLEFHYGKHHKHYVETLNELIQGTSLDRKNLEEIMSSTVGKKQKLYNNAAQTWNHTFFWNCMVTSGRKPSTELTKTIEKNFGSFDDFKNEFATEAKDLFGSGWTWLVKDKRGKLKIRSLGNAGNPLAEFGDTPLLTCDVWEHAYYLDYKNERPKFLEHFWKIINWEFVEANLEQASERVTSRVSQPTRRSIHQEENRV